MASTTKGKIFYAEATKGYALKVMIDSLALMMPRTTFRVTKKGFFHRKTDEIKQILIDIDLPRKNFRTYRCKKDILFSVNLKHMQKLVRNVKKKDSVIIYINRNCTDKLGIAIRPSGSTSGHNSLLETDRVKICMIEECEMQVDLPEDFYYQPKVIDAAAFQKMKKMTTVGKSVTVKIQESNYISFYSDNGELYDSEIQFGEIIYGGNTDDESGSDEDKSECESEGEEDDDEESEKNSDSDSDSDSDDGEEIKGWYEAEFNMSVFSLLMKLPGLCSQMQFYAPTIERYPVKIGMQAGTLGEIKIYIKDAKQLAIEQTENDQSRAEGISNVRK